MTKDKTIQQVRNLHKTNIIVEKKEGLFGRQTFSLVFEEDGQKHKILQAFYKGGFWNSGCYKIVAESQSVTSILQEKNIENEQTLNDDDNSRTMLEMAGNNDTRITTRPQSIITNNNNDNRSEVEIEEIDIRTSIRSSPSRRVRQENNSELIKVSKSFHMFKKHHKKLKKNIDNHGYNHYINIGNIESSGLFFDTTIIHDEHGDSKGFVMYESTSRTGELMKLKIALPKVHKESVTNIGKMIANAGDIPDDLGLLIAGFVGNVYWSQSFKNIKLGNCSKLYKDNGDTLMKFHNKMPSWNPAIAAYAIP